MSLNVSVCQRCYRLTFVWNERPLGASLRVPSIDLSDAHERRWISRRADCRRPLGLYCLRRLGRSCLHDASARRCFGRLRAGHCLQKGFSEPSLAALRRPRPERRIARPVGGQDSYATSSLTEQSRRAIELNLGASARCSANPGTGQGTFTAADDTAPTPPRAPRPPGTARRRSP